MVEEKAQEHTPEEVEILKEAEEALEKPSKREVESDDKDSPEEEGEFDTTDAGDLEF